MWAMCAISKKMKELPNWSQIKVRKSQKKKADWITLSRDNDKIPKGNRVKMNLHGRDVSEGMFCNGTVVLKIDSIYKQSKKYHS